MPRPRLRALAALSIAVALGGLVGCAQHEPPARSQSPPIAPTTPPAPQPPPRTGTCHRLSFEEAGHPTDDSPATRCSRRHTSVTFAVGHLARVRDGHLLATDSRAVAHQMADRCSTAMAGYLGGDRAERRLSRFQAVWFGPGVRQASRGADWYRCDVVAVARKDRLARLGPRIRHVLDRPGALDRYGTCGTAAPSSSRFERVICSLPHRWRAVDVVGLPAHAAYLQKSVGRAADQRCKQIASARANGALEFTWSFEWPTRQAWDTGQRYGYCWLPSR